jgi:preprotein translocase subunit SecA
MEFLKIEESQPIEHAMIGKAIEQAQVKVEGFFFDQRKRLVEFDDVMNQQREVIYSLRRKILFGERDIHADTTAYVDDAIEGIVSMHAPEDGSVTDEDVGAIVKEFVTIIPFDDASQLQMKKRLSSLHSSEELSKELLMFPPVGHELPPPA